MPTTDRLTSKAVRDRDRFLPYCFPTIRALAKLSFCLSPLKAFGKVEVLSSCPGPDGALSALENAVSDDKDGETTNESFGTTLPNASCIEGKKVMPAISQPF